MWLPAGRQPALGGPPVWQSALRLALRPFIVFFLVLVNRRFLGGGIGALGIDV